MRSAFRAAMLLFPLLVLPLVVPAAARAGWVSDWINQAALSNGERTDSQDSSMKIANDRVRTEQRGVITVIDYDNGRFIMMNPIAETFWSGTVDQYAADIANRRDEALESKRRSPGEKARKAEVKRDSAPKVDPAKLPPISIKKTDVKANIAGYDTSKYDVWGNGELFYEFWLAPTLDVTKDLNIDRYLTQQRKMSAAMAGKSAGLFNALYLSDEYRQLLGQGFVLKTITHHIAGSFERTATSMRQADIAASEFEVPDSYRKVKLSEVMPAAPTPPAKK